MPICPRFSVCPARSAREVTEMKGKLGIPILDGYLSGRGTDISPEQLPLSSCPTPLGHSHCFVFPPSSPAHSASAFPPPLCDFSWSPTPLGVLGTWTRKQETAPWVGGISRNASVSSFRDSARTKANLIVHPITRFPETKERTSRFPSITSSLARSQNCLRLPWRPGTEMATSLLRL
jgi:hypothetical protein